ncbi:BRCA1-associated RING domain protein 1 [Geodia barretti]|uniref:BRCA1-associated RING domain protein 1 n=1 Tax=Geodia barretti TaxID=519541 RepID=A0AA35T044_GEOBA|nr:BRCA1-associated RING domain protein 1 [Geodia barretti]
MQCQQWCNTRPALSRLIQLLSCPLCDSLMSDPCVLNNCNHHFCRRCIEWSISEKQASCPICLLPAWAKDVKSDRQIGTVIGCVSSMDSHILQATARNTHGDSCGNPIRRKLKSRRGMRQQCLMFPPVSKTCEPSPVCSEKGPSSNNARPRKTPKLKQRNIRGETPLHIAAIKVIVPLTTHQ